MPPAPRLAIAATAFQRPIHLDRMLCSVARARNHAHWPLYLSVEPSERTQEVLDVIETHRGTLDLHVRVNAQRKGVRQNPHDNIVWAFEQKADLVLLLEDDLVIGRDALEYCELLNAGALGGDEVVCANLLMTTCNSESIHCPASEDEHERLREFVIRTRFFSSVGVLFSRQQWQRHFAPNWFRDGFCMENWEGHPSVGWDVAMNGYLLANRGLQVLQSLVPRVTHDGAGGTHVTDDFQARSFDNVQLPDTQDTPLRSLQVLDARNDLMRIPSPTVRLYVNLCRHLWTQQTTSIAHRLIHRGIPES
ncbi:glycosyltransferase [Caldimonas tepidiphila]|uniref:glycosyltransferase n=1 Tax=Caldimonas tepidiphila TaxID=2315841 RepID=UPI0013003B72|nr:hypothetical protein [Caldimonas tepidiphila]